MKGQSIAKFVAGTMPFKAGRPNLSLPVRRKQRGLIEFGDVVGHMAADVKRM